MVPTGTGNQGKPGKMGRHFPVREKSGNFVKTGKVREFYSKYWKNQKKLHWKIEKNTGKVRETCYLYLQLLLLANNSENPANMVPYFK